jgi:hypothetical protein
LLWLLRVSARDSGKTPLEAVMGEIIVTAEKLRWLINEGEHVLKPQQRGAGVMVRMWAGREEGREEGRKGYVEVAREEGMDCKGWG